MKTSTQLAYRVAHNPLYLIAFGFGSGLMPVAPGTFGTLAAVPIYACVAALPLWGYAVFLLGTFLLGVWVCDYVSKALKVHDYPGIVWDECVGYWITMTGLPMTWQWMLAGFLMFRVFDIFKIGPIRAVDRYVRNGLGIMLDDVLAGAAACLVLHALKGGLGL